MTYLLSKLLPICVYPLGVAIILCLFSLLLLRKGLKRSAYLSVLMASTLLWISSTNIFANYLIGTLENSFPPVSAQHLSNADAIVILGGVVGGIVPGTEVMNLSGSIERLFHAVNIFKEKKAEIIILSGGSATGFPPEAEMMQRIMVQLGVPLGNMLLENRSRNTYQNAVYTMELIKSRGVKHILLVTSAFHMKRARAVFEALGVVVSPAATDYLVIHKASSILDWLPSADALSVTTLAIKEYLGWWVYSLRGWV